MVAETIILRPTSSTLAAARLFPTDTETSNGHLLVSEEVADDDATYVISSDTWDMLNGNGFCFSVDSLEIPTAMRVIFRAKYVNADSAYMGALMPLKAGQAGVGVSSSVDLGYTYVSDSYKHYTLNVPYERIPEIWEYMQSDAVDSNGVKGSHFVFYAEKESGGGTKSTFEVRLTQLYLEIDYDDGQYETYFKKSGNWENASGTVYRKINGTWFISNLNDLSDGNNIIVKEI